MGPICNRCCRGITAGDNDQPEARDGGRGLNVPGCRSLATWWRLWRSSTASCVHPIPVRRVDPETGATDIVDVPCGATVSSKCPSCAERARLLRVTQCRQGWHLDVEPMLEPDDPSDEQLELATLRADLEAVRARAVA